MEGPIVTFEEATRRMVAGLASRPARRIVNPELRPSAVVVPLLDRPDGPTLLFTERGALLRAHGGQVAFPGGKLEPGEDARAGALREAREEIGLEPEAIELVGELDDRPSVWGYVVRPVVGFVGDPPATFDHSEGEVREVFEVPLLRFLDPGALRTEWWDFTQLPSNLYWKPFLAAASEVADRDGRYPVLYFDVDPGHVIWGLTASILQELLERSFRDLIASPA